MRNTKDRKRGNGKLGPCPACNLAFMSRDGEGTYCPNCLYTPGPRITLEDAVERAEAVAVAESRALRADLERESGSRTTRRRAA
ncbi:MAG: hypothetical protein HY560_02735 [Gemmatimonadetes bacterium]|nr:hypothetical protein [Gemmatimonadota bacterium]